MSTHKTKRPTKAQIRSAIRSLEALQAMNTPRWCEEDEALLARLRAQVGQPAKQIRK